MSEPPGGCDIAVVGAGIVGLAVARELGLRHPDARLVVLEREQRVGLHQTGRNSGVIHQGVYYRPGSLKAQLCASGARMLYEYCRRRNLPVRVAGKLIVALDEAEMPRLDELERRARANGVPGLTRVDRRQIVELEPHCAGLAGLYSPETGVTDFLAVARELTAGLEQAGVVIATGCPVLAVHAGGRRIHLRHPRGVVSAAAAVFCAGAWADRLAVMCGAGADPRIVPFRGGYLRLRPQRSDLVQGLIYPVPDPDLPFLGVHLTRQVGGGVTLGPSALLAGGRSAGTVSARDLAASLSWPGTARMVRRHWRTGLGELRMALDRRSFVAAAARYVPELRPADVLAGPVGVRGQAVARDGSLVDDFVFDHTERALHVRNAPSPAATAALAIAGYVAGQAETRLGIGQGG